MEKAEPIIKHKIDRRGHITKRSLEQYLRNDIPCCVPSCPSCVNRTPFVLSDHFKTVFVVGSAEILSSYINVIAFLKNFNFVLLTSVIVQFKERSPTRKFAALKKLLKEQNHRIAIFDNTFCSQVRAMARDTENRKRAGQTNTADLVEAASRWYAGHLPDWRIVLLGSAPPSSAEMKGGKAAATLSDETAGESEDVVQLLEDGSEMEQGEFDGRLIRMPFEAFCRNADNLLAESFLRLSSFSSPSPRPSQPLLNQAGTCLVAGQANEGELLKPEHPLWKEIESVRLMFEAASNVAESTAGDVLEGGYDEFWAEEQINSGMRAGEIFRGHINLDRNNWQEAYVNCLVAENEYRKIFVLGRKNINRVVHGDEVAVRLLPREDWKSSSAESVVVEDAAEMGEDGEASQSLAPSKDEAGSGFKRGDKKDNGKVVGVFRQNWRPYVATMQLREETDFSQKNNESILCVPFDARVPKIRIQTRQADQYRNSRLKVAIDTWEKNSMYPSGHLVEEVGPIGDIETETRVILIENQLESSPFGKALDECLPSNWEIPEEERLRRLDIRHDRLVFSVDPIGCEDIDDALSVHQLANGVFEIGVHIADVTHFVGEGSLVDREARQRGTTVYMSDRRIDMIPRRLSAKECSLREKEDKLTVSVFWRVDFTAGSGVAVSGSWFRRTVARSSFALNYVEANLVLQSEGCGEAKEKINRMVARKAGGSVTMGEEIRRKSFKTLSGIDEEQFSRVRAALLVLSRFAIVKRQQREKDGAVSFNSDWRLRFDDGKDVDRKIGDMVEILSISKNQSKSNILSESRAILMNSHNIIEEMMVLANRTVADQIKNSFPGGSLLRRHSSPLISAAKEMNAALLTMDIPRLNFESNAALAESMRIANKSGDERSMTVVKDILLLFLRSSMSEAEYFSTGDKSYKNFSHFGLAIESYTHFTSPIRRYADIVVHRLLLESMNKGPQQNEANSNQNELISLCSHLNVKNRSSRNAQRMSKEFRKICELQNCFYYTKAVVIGIRANGLLVFVHSFLVDRDEDSFEDEDEDQFFKGVVMLKNKEGKFNPPFNLDFTQDNGHDCQLTNIDQNSAKLIVPDRF